MGDTELLRFCNLREDKQATKMEALRENILEDPDFRLPRIKLDGKKPRYELPMPVKGDPDNCEIEPSFMGVVLLAKKNFYQSDEDKEAGNDPKEKRALYVLRLGRYVPDLFYISPTAVRNWKYFVRDIVKGGHEYFGVLVEFSAEAVKGAKYTWSKPKFSVVRTLTEAEYAHVTELRDIVNERVSQWEADADLDKYEDEALAVDHTGDRIVETDDVRQIKKRQADVEDDDESPASPVSGKKSKSKPKEDEEEEEKPRKSSSRKQEEDDDEDEPKAKKSSKSKVAEDDDEDEPKKKKSSKSKAAEDDEDEDEEPKKKSSKSKVDDDEDDDEPKAKKSSKSKVAEDEDDDEPKAKKGKKGSYPSLDDDDD
jgi:hypothetical protein